MHFDSNEMSSTGNSATLLTSAHERKKLALVTVTAERVLAVVFKVPDKVTSLQLEAVEFHLCGKMSDSLIVLLGSDAASWSS